jgi:hypothetical protein
MEASMVPRRLPLFLLALTLASPLTIAAQEPYDLIIRNGRVLDGSGNPRKGSLTKGMRE